MGDLDDRRTSAVDLGEYASELGTSPGVEAGRRLVEDEDPGFHGKDAGDGAQTSLTARELEGGGVRLPGDSHEVEGTCGATGDLARREAHVAWSVRGVLEDGLRKELPLRMLHDEAHDAVKPAAVAAFPCGYAIDEDTTLVRYLESAYQTKERRFSRACLSDDGAGGACGDGERHVGEGGMTAGVVGVAVRDVLADHRRFIRGRAGTGDGRVRSVCLAGACSGEAVPQLVFVAGQGHAHAMMAQCGREARRKGGLERQAPKLTHVREDLARRALDGDSATVHDDDAVGGEGLVHEMRDVYEGCPRDVYATHDVHDRSTAANVEKGAGFIEHENPSFHGECASDGDALLLTTGETGGVHVGICLESNTVQFAGYASPDFFRGHAEVLGAERHVFRYDRSDDLIVGVLKHETDFTSSTAIRAEIGVSFVEHVLAHEFDRSRVRGKEPADHRGERGLSRTVGAQHTDPLARRDRKAYVIERDHVLAIDEGHVLE